MNKRFTYEQIISNHLDNIPIQDMQDIIWQKIEKELIHQEVNTSSNTTTNKTFFPRKKYKSVILELLTLGTALGLLILLIAQFKNTKSRQLPSPIIHKHQPSIDIPQKGEQKKDIHRKQDGSPAPSNPKVDTSGFNLPDIKPKEDSINLYIQKNELPNPSIEAPAVQKPLIIQPPKKDSLPRKSRGVSGISDSDYYFKLIQRDTLNMK